jgi:DNA-directed RNA polymerase subunit M/transcription elongation factor TFIIS
MSRSTVQCIVLTQKAEVKQAKLALQEGSLSLDSIKQYLKKKDNPEILGTYKYKTYTLTLLGYTKGKAGTENKHELPPPLDSNLCFGDIVLVASTTPSSYTKPVNFKADEYEAFYTKIFGFEDLNSEDEDEEEEEEDEVAEIQEEKEKVVLDDEGGEEEEDEEEGDDEKSEAEAELVEPEHEVEEDVQIRPVKANKKKRAAAAIPGASQILHIPKDDHLDKDVTSTANAFPNRLSTIEQIGSLLKDVNATELERCMYNSCISEAHARHVTCHWRNSLFQHIYQTKVRHIIGNLLPNGYVQNTKLLSDLHAGKYTLEELCNLDTYMMCNERWRDFIHRRTQREKRQLEGNKAMATDQFYCTKCHKRECTYYEMQTRSADEPMTVFITCLNCGKHWRQ